MLRHDSGKRQASAVSQAGLSRFMAFVTIFSSDVPPFWRYESIYGSSVTKAVSPTPVVRHAGVCRIKAIWSPSALGTPSTNQVTAPFYTIVLVH